jgi:peptidylprolyl isomerase
MKIRLLPILLFLSLLLACNSFNSNSRIVKITTEKGDIILRLYNETPKHRDNFIKLAENKFFDEQIFHRVINNFVIQGGDPDTKKALPDSLYGNNDSGYLIDAEIIDTIYHKRGALGMAREGDDINPDKKSSGSQFYIVKGKLFTDQQLDELEKKRDMQNKSKIYNKLFSEKISALKDKSKIDTVSIALDISVAIDSIWEKYPKFKFSEKQRNIYKTIGGIPHLDGNYTVFGEVLKGMEIVDELSAVPTDKNDRPLKDIKFTVSVIN